MGQTATWLLNYQSEHLLTSLTRTLKYWAGTRREGREGETDMADQSIIHD